jgi:hypothetical protein
MKQFLIFLILVIALTAGCVQSEIKSGYMLAKPEKSGFQILSSSWGFEDKCKSGNASVAYVKVSCEKDLECEVYVNSVKSKYGFDGLQPCTDELVVAEKELDYKPDFATIQNGGKYYYTRRDKNKFILICCSHVDTLSQKFDRDNEICQTTTLNAQCREQVADGFDQIKVLTWELHHDGFLNLNIKNNAGQSVVINKIYLSGESFSDLNKYLSDGSNSTINLSGGPTGSIGDGYGIGISIEYTTALNSDIYFNSTGTISGAYS